MTAQNQKKRNIIKARYLIDSTQHINSKPLIQNLNATLEPYTSPGDYNVPHLLGNKKISIAGIKTPPQFTFAKSNRLDNDLSKSMVSSHSQFKTIMSIKNHNLNKSTNSIGNPGVGDYDIEKFDVKKKQPICTIGNQMRFQKIPSQQ